MFAGGGHERGETRSATLAARLSRWVASWNAMFTIGVVSNIARVLVESELLRSRCYTGISISRLFICLSLPKLASILVTNSD